MVDVILVIANSIFGISILIYFYLREIKHRQDARQDVAELQKFYREGIESYKTIYQSRDSLVRENFNAYLKHIQSLEKMILPKAPLPVTREMVESIIGAPAPIPNEIDKTQDDLAQEEFAQMLNKVQITPETKVAFEGDTNFPGSLEEEIL